MVASGEMVLVLGDLGKASSSGASPQHAAHGIEVEDAASCVRPAGHTHTSRPPL